MTQITPHLGRFQPLRRITSTPKASLISIAQLMSQVSQIRCDEHRKAACVHAVTNGHVMYGACCVSLLDRVERQLRSDSAI